MASDKGFEESLNFNEICRVCMGKKLVMRPIYGSSLDSMLKSVANVQIQLNDGLPTQMCVQCVLQVSRAFTFKQQCERTDITLRLYLSHKIEQQQNLTETIVSDPLETPPITMEFESLGETQCVLILKSDGILSATNDPSSNYVVSTLEPLEQEEDDLEQQEHFLSDHSVVIENELSQDHNIETFSIDEDDNQLELPSETITGDNDYVHMDSYSDAGDISLLVTVKDCLFPKCEECGVEFTNEDELNEHKISHNTPPSYENNEGGGSYPCNICNKHFSAARILKRHAKTHLIYKPHVCNTCGMSFAESCNLTKHKKKHTGELRNIQGKPHLCSVCGKRFKWSSSLSKHMKHHTKSKLFVCPYCPKYYVEARSLSIHMRSHTGEKPYSCSYCEKTFTQKCNLEKHVRVHTGEKPFQCSICGRSFSQSGYVVIHMRTHSKEKPYGCTDCGKQFVASTALTIHKRIHSGEKPYGCDICEKKFARQETLTIHQRTHTGEKPHVCFVCPAKFASSRHLSAHVKTHDANSVYTCSVCSKQFTTNNSLKNHMRHHNKASGKEKPGQNQVKEKSGHEVMKDESEQV